MRNEILKPENQIKDLVKISIKCNSFSQKLLSIGITDSKTSYKLEISIEISNSYKKQEEERNSSTSSRIISNHNYNIEKTYDEIEELYERLMKKYDNSILENIPNMGRTSIFNIKSIKELEKKKKLVNCLFEFIVSNMILIEDTDFLDFIQFPHLKKILNIRNKKILNNIQLSNLNFKCDLMENTENEKEILKKVVFFKETIVFFIYEIKFKLSINDTDYSVVVNNEKRDNMNKTDEVDRSMSIISKETVNDESIKSKVICYKFSDKGKILTNVQSLSYEFKYKVIDIYFSKNYFIVLLDNRTIQYIDMLKYTSKSSISPMENQSTLVFKEITPYENDIPIGFGESNNHIYVVSKRKIKIISLLNLLTKQTITVVSNKESHNEKALFIKERNSFLIINSNGYMYYVSISLSELLIKVVDRIDLFKSGVEKKICVDFLYYHREYGVYKCNMHRLYSTNENEDVIENRNEKNGFDNYKEIVVNISSDGYLSIIGINTTDCILDSSNDIIDDDNANRTIVKASFFYIKIFNLLNNICFTSVSFENIKKHFIISDSRGHVFIFDIEGDCLFAKRVIKNSISEVGLIKGNHIYDNVYVVSNDGLLLYEFVYGN